jgi:hypothetical protein
MDLVTLVRTVFDPRPPDRALLVLADVPDARVLDSGAWRERRTMAREWAQALEAGRAALGLERVSLLWYPNVGSNNADLPERFSSWDGDPERLDRARLEAEGRPVARDEALRGADLVIAPTELSATAPLKLLARSMGFRGATLPGFTKSMTPALGLDYGAVDRRVRGFAERLSRAEACRVRFAAVGREFAMDFDLRHRDAHVSSGLIRERGTVGNLPSGESYIVPYEGERAGDPSRTAGELPVQIADELVLYRVEGNVAREVLTTGRASWREADLLASEPAYGNMAEVGLGVLGEFGIQACGSVLLDEKLGLHVAFGRSDHFGGATGPKAFRDPAKVIHLDRVYVPSLQPAVTVAEAVLVAPGGATETILRDGRYVV